MLIRPIHKSENSAPLRFIHSESHEAPHLQQYNGLLTGPTPRALPTLFFHLKPKDLFNAILQSSNIIQLFYGR